MEVTRPARQAFTVRVFDDDFTPPDADVLAVFVLYGPEVAELGRLLEVAWEALGLRGIARGRYACYRSYDHSRSFTAVLKTIEALQESFHP